MLTQNLTNRRLTLKKLQSELVGPSPQGKPINCNKPIRFESFKESYGPWKQQENSEEILQRDSPTKRYGIGVLYPWQLATGDSVEDAGDSAIGMHGKSEGSSLDEDEADDSASVLTDEAKKDLEKTFKRDKGYESETGDLDLSASNTYRPSSMGISFLADLPPGAKVIVDANVGRYKAMEIQVKGFKREITWWRRIPVQFSKVFDAEEILSTRKTERKLDADDDIGSIDLCIELYSRPNPLDPAPSQRLLTVCMVNRSNAGGKKTDELCVFQSTFTVRVVSEEAEDLILPYPETPLSALDNEEMSLALLYRNFQTYATGHGCAANWGNKSVSGQVNEVRAECLPTFETPSTTPDINDTDGNPIIVSMAALAGLLPAQDGFDELERVVELYEKWITEKTAEIADLPDHFQDTAYKHLENCSKCATRMKSGIKYLLENPIALQAFRLANHSILLQQLTARTERTVTYDSKAHRWVFSREYEAPDVKDIPLGRGQWRAFQIAFLLMSLRSSVEENDPDRDTVELIWFPTGGGKTEAYLGLTAFSLFYRRLKNPEDTGVHVITRYTLRLLTAQQFQRATKLVCAMEAIREVSLELGTTPFSIGIWVGGSNTPNTRKGAVAALSNLQRDRYAENKFILGQCPWCGAQMGQIITRSGRKTKVGVVGYYRRGDTVAYACSDQACRFHSGLPVYSIDEDIYASRPSIVIGTVDKFATLTWRPEARTLFGINPDGTRDRTPPGLVIQDELHLISGPLGSMVGLYESVIEELCTDRRNGHAAKPKIVSSTATIRRYEEQVKALYGRNDVVLFPPSGIDASDSFFARYAREKTGKLKPGRIYVGVHGPGLGSLQTVQVRTFTSLLQSPTSIGDAKQQDPWWTLLIFFNSLRELGTTLSLFQSDIPDYLKVTAQRIGIAYSSMRRLWRVRELTGRLRSDEVPEAISALEVTTDNIDQKHAVDACLASNILEVGVDIDRLSLMAVVGQPKSTSQYIQVTGRVGRRWWERPGLVVTIYTASKPRDRSHFEKFRTYHERLYAQVEPVSVTPFSPPALDRALHAVMSLFARQIGNEEVANSPYPFPEQLIAELKTILIPRVEVIDPEERQRFEEVFDKRAAEWRRWQRTAWERRNADESFLLLRAGEYVEPENQLLSWQTPTSMRNVDAECEAQITSLYIQEDED
jgi:hypothetical protein